MPDREAGTQELCAIRDWIVRELGIQFGEEQSELLEHRLRMMFGSGQESIEDTWRKLRRGDPTTSRRVAEAVSTNHTFFYREPEAFEVLRDEILPALPEEGTLRLWSAAASSGEEAYSIAMCMKRALGPSYASRVRILGTDISERQIRLAESGVYERGVAEKLPLELREYFVQEGAREVRVAKDVRDACVFRRMNLSRFPWPFEHGFHVVFLRNVLYYFDTELRARVVSACFDAAMPGAFLVLGLSEPVLDVASKWTLVRHGLFRKDRA